MKNERLFELLSHIDEKYIEESENITLIKNKKRNPSSLFRILAACLCLLLISAAVIGIIKNPAKPDTAQSPAPTPNADNSVTFEKLNTVSKAPINCDDQTLLSGGAGNNLAAEEISPCAAMVVRLSETKPDTYLFYDYPQIEYMLLEMETLEVLHGNNIPNKFYFLIPEGCFTDFSLFDRFVLTSVVQYGYDYSVMYNTAKDCPEILDKVILGAYGLYLTTNGGASDIVAFDENGDFDSRLYESTEGFTGGSGWHREENRERIVKENATLELTVNRILEDTWGEYYLSDSFYVRTFSDFSEESKAALEYIKNTENGLYVQSFENYTREIHFSKSESVLFRRYIDGIPTNETITLYPEKAEYSASSFDEAETSSLPLLRSAQTKIREELEKGKITPSHIEGFDNTENASHGIFCWCANTEEGIVGIIRVFWHYKRVYTSGCFDILYDDIYYIVKPDADTCVQIDRDELLELFGTYETTFIYNGKYDNKGMVYEGRDDDYIIAY